MTSNKDFKQIGQAPRPTFFTEEPAADRLLAIVAALTTEVAVLRERQDSLERLIIEKGILEPDELEQYIGDTDVQKSRAAWREAYLERVYAILRQAPMADNKT